MRELTAPRPAKPGRPPRGSSKVAKPHLLESAKPGLGLTLVELMVGLTIAGLLAITAMPHFADYTQNARLREAGHLLLAEAMAAQSEAIKRNSRIRLAASSTTVQLLDLADPTQPVLVHERSLSTGLSVGTASIDFSSDGRTLPFGTVGAIDLSITGISCSSDLRCPGLRVDAGGTARLCVDRRVGCP